MMLKEPVVPQAFPLNKLYAKSVSSIETGILVLSPAVSLALGMVLAHTVSLLNN